MKILSHFWKKKKVHLCMNHPGLSKFPFENILNGSGWQINKSKFFFKLHWQNMNFQFHEKKSELL